MDAENSPTKLFLKYFVFKFIMQVFCYSKIHKFVGFDSPIDPTYVKLRDPEK